MHDIRIGSLNKALTANSQEPDWSLIEAVATEPTTGTFVSNLNMGQQELKIHPCSASNPTTDFFMRLWGWNHHGVVNDVNRVIWLPFLIVEVHCVVGKKGGRQSRLLSAIEHFAEKIELVQGTVGKNGIIVSLKGEAAWMRVDLQFSQKFQFDFRSGTATENNALWSEITS